MADEWSPEASARWLLSLSKLREEDILHGRPGDVPNWVFDLGRYIDVEPEDERVKKELAQVEREPRMLLHVSKTIRELLTHIADKTTFRYPYGAGELVFDASKLPDEGPLSYHDAHLTDAVVQVAVDDLSHDIALRVKRCANHECREVFFAERRSQIYCGHRCANLIASRTYREQAGNQEKRRTHATRKYREKAIKSRK